MPIYIARRYNQTQFFHLKSAPLKAFKNKDIFQKAKKKRKKITYKPYYFCLPPPNHIPTLMKTAAREDTIQLSIQHVLF